MRSRCIEVGPEYLLTSMTHTPANAWTSSMALNLTPLPATGTLSHVVMSSQEIRRQSDNITVRAFTGQSVFSFSISLYAY